MRRSSGMSGDWLAPSWLRDAMSAWTPPSIPNPLADSVRQVVDLFGFAPAAIAKEVVDAAGTRLVGQAVQLRFGELQVTCIVRAMRLQRPPLGLMVGQLGDVDIVLQDVRWDDRRVAWLRIEARNVHIQPGAPAELVVAPVRAEATIDQETVDEVVQRTAPRVRVELVDDGEGIGVARATLANRPHWGHVDLTPRVEGDVLVLRPATVSVRGAMVSARLVHRIPALRFPLPEALAVGHVTDVVVDDGSVRVRGVLDEWREPLAPRQLDQVVRRITSFAGPVLDLPRTAR